MKNVFSAQIMEERKYTNHSLRATAATILFHAGFDEQLIAAITKHKSLAGLRSYKHIVPEQLAVALQTIHGNTNRSKEINFFNYTITITVKKESSINNYMG